MRVLVGRHGPRVRLRLDGRRRLSRFSRAKNNRPEQMIAPASEPQSPCFPWLRPNGWAQFESHPMIPGAMGSAGEACPVRVRFEKYKRSAMGWMLGKEHATEQKPRREKPWRAGFGAFAATDGVAGLGCRLAGRRAGASRARPPGAVIAGPRCRAQTRRAAAWCHRFPRRSARPW